MLNVMDAQRVRKWNCIMDQALAQGCGEHRLLLLRVMFVIGGRVLNPTHEATPRSGWHPSPLAIGISCTRLASCIAQVRASASRNTVLYGKPYTWYCSKFIFSYITCIYDNILNIHTKGFLVIWFRVTALRQVSVPLIKNASKKRKRHARLCPVCLLCRSESQRPKEGIIQNAQLPPDALIYTAWS